MGYNIEAKQRIANKCKEHIDEYVKLHEDILRYGAFDDRNMDAEILKHIINVRYALSKVKVMFETA